MPFHPIPRKISLTQRMLNAEWRSLARTTHYDGVCSGRWVNSLVNPKHALLARLILFQILQIYVQYS